MTDVDTNILRKPTEKDKQYFDIDLNKPRYRKKSARERFEDELAKQEQEAIKNGLPFARHVARDDFEQAIATQVNEQMRKYGRVEFPEEVKLPEIDWKKYSDLKNFELVEESERYDENETRKNPGLTIVVKTKKYTFKGYKGNYVVMEPISESIQRARKLLKNN